MLTFIQGAHGIERATAPDGTVYTVDIDPAVINAMGRKRAQRADIYYTATRTPPSGRPEQLGGDDGKTYALDEARELCAADAAERFPEVRR